MPQEIRQTADLLERRWQISILYAANLGALRFNEYVEAIGDISARMLKERLGELEAAGLVERVIVHSSPPHYEYRLTPRGRELVPLLDAMRQAAAIWGR